MKKLFTIIIAVIALTALFCLPAAAAEADGMLLGVMPTEAIASEPQVNDLAPIPEPIASEPQLPVEGTAEPIEAPTDGIVTYTPGEDGGEIVTTGPIGEVSEAYEGQTPGYDPNAWLEDVVYGPDAFEDIMQLMDWWYLKSEDKLNPAYPAYICGVWYNEGAEGMTVSVTNDEAGVAGKAEILSVIRDDSSVTFTNSKYSYAELKAVVDEITATGITADKSTGVFGVGVNEQENNVWVEYDTNTVGENPDWVAGIEEKYGDKVKVVGQGLVYITGPGAVGIPEIGGVDMGTEETVTPIEKNGSEYVWFVAAAVLVAGAAAFLLVRGRRAAAQTNVGTVEIDDGPVSTKQVEDSVKAAEIQPSEKLDREIMDKINKA